jgi:hypothetical protein
MCLLTHLEPWENRNIWSAAPCHKYIQWYYGRTFHYQYIYFAIVLFAEIAAFFLSQYLVPGTGISNWLGGKFRDSVALVVHHFLRYQMVWFYFKILTFFRTRFQNGRSTQQCCGSGSETL